MALESQTINFPLFQGLNTKIDSKQIPLGEMSLLENVIFKTVQKFRKRNGYAALSTNVLTPTSSFTFQKFSSTITNGSFTSPYKDQKTMGDGFGFYSYSDSDSKWVYRGRCESARVDLKDVYKVSNQFPPGGSLLNTVNSIYHPDSAYNSTTGLQLFAWEPYLAAPLEPTSLGTQAYGVQYILFDYETGTELLTGAISAASSSRPKCVSIGSTLYIFYFQSSDNTVKAVSVTSAGISSATNVVTDIDPTYPNYDLLVNNSLIYIGYNGTGSTVKIASFNSALTLQASVSKAEVATNGIGIFPDTSNNIWCAYNNATETKAFIMDSALSVTVLAPTVVNAAQSTNVLNVTGVYDGTRGVIFWDKPNERSVAQYTGIQVSADYTQPAVGSTVAITVGSDPAAYAGQIIFITSAGFYKITTTTATTMTALNLGGLSNAAPTTLITFPENIHTTGGHIFSQTFYNTLTAAGSAGTVASFCGSLSLNSRAFLYSSVPHVFLSYDSPTQPTNFLASLYDVNASATNTPHAHIVARIASNFSGGIPYKSILPSVNNISGNIYQTPSTVRVINLNKTINYTAYANFINGLSSAEINLSPTQISKQEIGDNLHIASGSLMMYDGQNVVEHGFHAFPDYLQLTDTGAGGRIADGVYSYCAVYAWIDAQGQIHRSAPSIPVTITTAGGNSIVQVLVPMLNITQKNDISIEIYRTAASGSIFYRIDSNAIGTSAFPNRNTVAGIGGSSSILYNDGYSDGEITGNQQLYTLGEVENIVAPSPRSVSLFKNRLVLVPSDDTTTYWYSKQVIPGSPVEMSDSFVQNTDQASGPIIGIVQLDDKEIVFKGGNIYYVVGSGPAPSGANNDFSDPILIATDVGLVDPESITVMPIGVMFKSQKGVYLLDRSMAVQYIGAKVEDYNSLTVVSSKLIANVNQVRMILGSGQAIVYDYFVNQWSVFTNHSAVDSMISENIYYYLKSNGTVLYETDGLFSDNGSFISMKFKTGWVQFAGVQGFQRIWKMLLLGEYISAHNLQIDVAVDFVSTIVQTKTFNPTANPYQWQLNPTIQKCESMQFTIQDVDTGTDGESYSLSNLAFEVGVKRGLNKFTQTRSG